MARSQTIGSSGETLARDYLRKKGYHHLASNWRCKVGELDLIMQDGATRVIVEVRTRRRTSFGHGAETVAWQKQRKLVRATQFYQQHTRYWGPLRFDVVSIVMEGADVLEITHILDAFEA